MAAGMGYGSLTKFKPNKVFLHVARVFVVVVRFSCLCGCCSCVRVFVCSCIRLLFVCFVVVRVFACSCVMCSFVVHVATYSMLYMCIYIYIYK